MTSKEINHDLVKFAYDNLNNLPKGEEYEKMISSVAYDCFHKDLWTRRNLAHEEAIDYADIRMKDYDNDIPKHQDARFKHLSKIFGQVHPETVLEAPFYVDYGFNVKLGRSFYGNFNLTLLDCTLIIFGDYVLIGPNCTFTTATHPTDPKMRRNGVEYALPITVGDHVWFGAGVNVMPGVTIGNGAVVGSGAVVTKDVPANTVVVGCPARVIKHLTPDDNKDDFKK